MVTTSSQQRIRVKICGITCVEDAIHAVQAGADALGFVFYPPSPRSISIPQARDIFRIIPPFVSRVALTVNASADDVKTLIDRLAVNCLQFHGSEEAAFCRSFGYPWIKALSVDANTDLASKYTSYTDADAILLDTQVSGKYGGTGECFDWSLLTETAIKPIILAGGLSAANVAEAISKVQPYAVDVSSGVESVPGRKDFAKMHKFITTVRNTEETR